MSMTPTAGRQAPNRSGRWVITAPTKQAAVGAALHRQLGRLGVAFLAQPLGDGDAIVEDVLLFELGAGPVPFLAVLAAAAEAGLHIHAAHLEPQQPADRERRRQRDVEPAVAVEQRRVVAVALQALLGRDEHRHLGPVLARDERLRHLVIVGVALRPGPLPELLSPVAGS